MVSQTQRVARRSPRGRRGDARRTDSRSLARRKFAGFVGHAPDGARRARVGPARPGRSRRRARRALRRLPRRARSPRLLGSRPAPAPRERAAAGRAGRVARRAGVRLRLRGSDRGGVEPARGARRTRRGRRVAAVRARARGVRLAAPHRRGPRRARRRPRERAARRARPSLRRPHSLISSARCSSDATATPPTGGAVRFLEGAGTRGTLELVAEELLVLLRDGVPAGARSRSSFRRPSATGRRSKPCSAASASPTRSSRRGASPATPLGHALRLAAPLRLVGRRTPRALRLPALAVLGHCALERRLRRGTAAGARDRVARPRRRGDGEAARGAARRAARPARGRRSDRGASARCSPRCSARHTGSTHRPQARRRGSTCAASAPRRRLLDELELWQRYGEPLGTDDVVARTRARRGAARRPRSPGASRCSTCCARARVASTSSSCSGSRKARCRGATAARRSSTTTAAASSARGSSDPTAVSRDRYLFYTALHARTSPPLPRARGGDRRRLAARGEPVLARRCRRVRPRRRRARDDAPSALAADVAARDGADASANGCARSRGSRPDDDGEELRARARRRERLDAPPRPRAHRVRPRHAAAQPGRARGARWPHDVLGDRARALRRLLVGVALRARRRPEDDRRRGRCDAARQASRTRRCTRSTAACRRSSAPIASRPENLDAGSVVSRALPRRRARAAACGSSSARSTLPSCARGCGATSSGSSPRRRSPELGSCRGASRSASAATARRPSCSAGSSSATALSQRQDRPDRRRPVQRARDRAGLQVGQGLALGAPDRRRAQAPGAAVHARAARPRRDRAARRRLSRAVGLTRRARDVACRVARRPARLRRSRLPRRARRSGGRSRLRAIAPARPRSGCAPATCGTIRAAVSARRGATSGRCAG